MKTSVRTSLSALASVAAVAGLAFTTATAPVNATPSTTEITMQSPTCNQRLSYDENQSYKRRLIVPGYNGSYDCTLRLGDRGPAVGVLQASLEMCYEVEAGQTNVFDETTEAAVKTMQQAIVQYPNGVYDGDSAFYMEHKGTTMNADGDIEAVCSVLEPKK